MSIENKYYSLCLNKHWLVLHRKTVRDAIISLCPREKEDAACLALDIQYELNSEGWPDYTKPISMTPTDWDNWQNLEVKPWHLAIHTCKKEIRVPSVIITKNYGSIPKKIPKPTNSGILQRDNFTCQISGKKLPKRQLSVDHLVPQSKSGKNTWTNLVAMDRKLNTIKGDKSLEELGWELIRKPVEPPPSFCFSEIEEITMKDWELFLIK